METKIAEISDGICRFSTFVPQIAPPAGFTFNQFLVLGDDPLLFHAGLRQMFPLITGWPDIVVAGVMGALGLWGGFQILSQARRPSCPGATNSR